MPDPETLPVIHAIKGMNLDMTCRDFQFAQGQSYTHEGSVKACRSGFHACPDDQHPLAVFGYYAPGLSRYFDVTGSGKTDRDGDKIAATQITIGVEITIPELVKRAVEWVWSRCTLTEGQTATGDRGAASATGYQGAAMSAGYAGRVSGSDGNALFAVERDGDYNIVSVASGIVGRDGIKAGVWYVCKGGALAEVTP